MTPDDRVLAKELNSKNKIPRLAIEDSFNEQMRKFAHTDYFVNHKILQSGINNWEQITTLCNLQTLFYNLFICAQNHGSQVTGTLGAEPPSVAEYLCSANNDLLIPFERED